MTSATRVPARPPCVLALRAVARQARLDQVEIADDLPDATGDEAHALLAEHIVAYRIDGPLFFAAAHRFLHELTDVAAEGRVFTTTPEAIVAARHHLHDSGALADRTLHR